MTVPTACAYSKVITNFPTTWRVPPGLLLTRITAGCMIRGLIEYRMKSIDEYKVYKQTQNNIECLLMNKCTLSRMSPSVSNMFDQYGVNIPSGSLVTCQGFNIHSVDFVKHYASCRARTPYLPCVTPFNAFEPYNTASPSRANVCTWSESCPNTQSTPRVSRSCTGLKQKSSL